MTMPVPARGYIASGEFNGNRSPQHIQNQIVKLYCDSINLEFILSRAEYWINGSTNCQLWAALKEGIKHIVFFSMWQLPSREIDRLKIYDYCTQNTITLHFASEQISLDGSPQMYNDLEILIKTNSSVAKINYSDHFELLKNII